MKSSLKNGFLYAFGFGLLGVIIYLNWEGNPDKGTPGIGDLIVRPVNLWMLLGAFVLYAVALTITFYRWYVLVRAQDLPLSLWNTLRLGLVGAFFNSLLPFGVGGDIFKAVILAREQSRRTVAIATIAVDRVLGLWTLGWVVAVSGGIFWLTGNQILANNADLKTIVRITALVVIVSGSIFVLMGMFSEEHTKSIAARLQRIPKLGGSFAELWRAGVMYRRKLKALGAAFSMTVVGHLCWVLIFYLCVLSFASEGSQVIPSFSEHLLIVPVGMTAQAMFPMPGGVGGGEAAYGALYQIVNAPAAWGILGCLVQRVIAWGVGFVGYVIYTRMKKELPPDELEAATAMAA